MVDIHRQGYQTLKEATRTKIGQQKKQADAELNSTLTSLRDEAKERNRWRHFRNTDTNIFNQQYEGGPWLRESKTRIRLAHHYQISEREKLVDLLCYTVAAKTEEEAHLRRLKYGHLMFQWQNQKESPR